MNTNPPRHMSKSSGRVFLVVGPNLLNTSRFLIATALYYGSICAPRLGFKNLTRNPKHTVCLVRFLRSGRFRVESLSRCDRSVPEFDWNHGEITSLRRSRTTYFDPHLSVIAVFSPIQLNRTRCLIHTDETRIHMSRHPCISSIISHGGPCTWAVTIETALYYNKLIYIYQWIDSS